MLKFFKPPRDNGVHQRGYFSYITEAVVHIHNVLLNHPNEKLKIIEPDKDSKYLSHLANFGNNEQILISSWENDDWSLSKKGEDELGNVIVTDKVESVILNVKL